MAKFWQDLGFLASLNVTDKLLVGKNADGTTMYTDLQSIYNRISQDYFSDTKPSLIAPGSVLSTPSKLSCFIAGQGSYTLPTGSVTLTGNINFIFYDLSGWTTQSLVTTTQRVITSNGVNPSETPYGLSEIGVFTDSNFNQVFFISRSTNPATAKKWETLITPFSYYQTLTSLSQVPRFVGQSGLFEGRWMKARSINVEPYWVADLTEENSYLPITSSPSNPTETPHYIGQEGIYTDSNFEQIFYIARSKTAAQKWVIVLTPSVMSRNLTSLNDVPIFVGQTARFSNFWYRAIATVSPPYWQLLVDAGNTFKALTSSASAPTETPDYLYQAGVFTDASFNQTLFLGRSQSAAQKWMRIINDYVLNLILASYVLKSAFAKTISTIASTVPDFKLQLGFIGEKFYLARSVFGDYWVEMVHERNLLNYIAPESICSNAKVVSNYRVEKYAHSAYTEFLGNGEFGITVYMCNDSLNYEGATGQKIRITRFYTANPSDQTSILVAEQGQTYGFVTLDNAALQVPNLLKIDESNVRIFFRGTQGGVNKIFYRDYNIETGLSTSVQVVQCRIKNESTLFDMSLTKTIEHYDYLRGTTNALALTEPEIFITSDIRKLSDGKWYSGLSLGSGNDTRATTILIQSSDNGATWTLLASPDPLLMPGITGTDAKFFWEATVAEDSTNLYMFGRGSSKGSTSSNGQAFGLWITAIAKTNLYSCTPLNSTSPVAGLTSARVYNISDQKPAILDLGSDGLFLVTQGSYYAGLAGTINSNRVTLDFVRITNNFSVYTKQFSLKDSNGIHSVSFSRNLDVPYMTYSTSKRRQPQNPPPTFAPQYKNTTEVAIAELNKRYFLTTVN